MYPEPSVSSVLKSYVYIDMKIELLLLKTLWMIDKFTIQMYMWFRVVHVHFLNFQSHSGKNAYLSVFKVGPAGCQFGILACLLVEVLQSIQMLKRPCLAILKIGGFIVFLFILGLLPWIDNWAHVCGFLFGFLLAFSLLPYVSFGEFDRRRKIIGIVLSLGGAIFLFIILVVLFYVLPLYDCPGCQYFNCIPLTEDFCKNMEVNNQRDSTYSSYL